MTFEDATQEERELCLCGGGPMGKVIEKDITFPITKTEPVEPVQGELF